MKLIVVGAAAMSAATASAATVRLSLGSCADASQGTPFEVPINVITPLPANGGPFCSVRVNGASSDLNQDTSQCYVLAGNSQDPIGDSSPLGGPYTGNVPLTAIRCSAQPSPQPSGGSPVRGDRVGERIDDANPDFIIPRKDVPTGPAKAKRAPAPEPTAGPKLRIVRRDRDNEKREMVSETEIDRGHKQDAEDEEE